MGVEIRDLAPESPVGAAQGTAEGMPAAEPSSPAADGRRVRGQRTRRTILERAAQIASAEGLEGLSIGRLAGELGVSKSGLFAHFGSKAELQLATVDAARETFLVRVVGRSAGDAGVDRLLSLTDSWLDYMEQEVFGGGCFFAAASAEFDGRPGPVRDRIASVMGEWLLALEAAILDAQADGGLPPDLDSAQLAFELHSLGMGANWAFQLYRDRMAFARARLAIRMRVAGGAAAPPRDGEAQRLLRQIEVDERAARRSLRDQIAKLERDLSALFTAAGPGAGVEWQVSSPGGPRTLDVGDLEALRDELARRVEETRQALRERTAAESEGRRKVEALVADPAGHKWTRISNQDIGEPGCRYRHSQPRLGLIGMLMGWWRVKISSGCP